MRSRSRFAILVCGNVSSLQPPLNEPLSPELALVCPELAERARILLPDPGWLAFVVKDEAPRPSRLQTLGLAAFCLLTTMTPLIWTALALPHH
jgi:hypothetical protein